MLANLHNLKNITAKYSLKLAQNYSGSYDKLLQIGEYKRFNQWLARIVFNMIIVIIL